MSQHTSHVTELAAGTSILVLIFSLSDHGATLEMREKGAPEVRVHKLTERCSALYKTGRSKSKLVGVLLHFTEGFGHLIDDYRTLRPKHMVQACWMLDVRNTENQNDLFADIGAHYKKVLVWLEPYRSMVIPRDFAQELRKIE